MHLVGVGLNHKTAPVEIREQLAFSGEKLHQGLKSLLAKETLSEAVILSTCNRTEVYAVCESSAVRGLSEIKEFLAETSEAKVDLDRHIYNLVDLEVVQHLFRVVSSLDSMILGEAQILGQVKNALHQALEYNSISAHLAKLFRQAIEVGKRIRTETEIGESAVSISYAAVELARKIFGEIKGRTVLVIGAGEMSELTVKTLAAHGVDSVLVANRTRSRAEELAKRFKGRAVDYDALTENMAKADIIISSTGAPHTVIKRDMVKQAMRLRRNRPLFMIDIAVPRDIEESIHNLSNVYLYNIDDLENVVEANLAKREQQVEKAEAIINEEIEKFSKWWSSRQVVPVIKALRSYGHSIRIQELERLFNRLPELSEKEKECITSATNLIVNKILHQPVVSLKEEASRSREKGILYTALLERLFNLEIEDKPGDTSSSTQDPRLGEV
ncbi:MAG: glutamyl-tRNA reductase [Firmicutes bacterium]|nr:glutamyl-tRNA reductase [Bacillota bacterium]